MKTRSYDMRARSASAQATRERILDRAQALFFREWYDDVTIAAVAEAAGVSGQTVLNHFGDKEGLFAAVVDHASVEMLGRRDSAEPGDVAGAVGILVDDYEITGDATVRLLAAEHRIHSLRAVMDMGRRNHRDWVERVFGAPGVTDELVVVTEVYAWKLLRRDRGLSRDRTLAAMARMVDALIADESRPAKSKRRSPR
jgi:AcrR family transcriptional regulator